MLFFINPKTYGLILNNGKKIIKIKGINNSDVDFYYLKFSFLNKTNTISLPTTFFSKKNLNINIFTQNKTLDLMSYNKRIWSEDLITTTPRTNNTTYTY